VLFGQVAGRCLLNLSSANMPTAMELEERKRRKEKIRREFFQAPLEGNRYQLVSLIGEVR